MSNTSKTSRRLPRMYKPRDDKGVIVSVPIREFGFSHLLFRDYYAGSSASERFKPYICSPTPHAYPDELAIKAWLRYQDILEPILRNQQQPVTQGERPFWPRFGGLRWIKRRGYQYIRQLVETERGLP